MANLPGDEQTTRSWSDYGDPYIPAPSKRFRKNRRGGKARKKTSDGVPIKKSLGIYKTKPPV